MATARARLVRERSGLQGMAGSYRASENPRNRTSQFYGGSGDTHADDRSRRIVRELTRGLERNAHTFAVLMSRWLDDLGVPMPRFASSDAAWNQRMNDRWVAKSKSTRNGWDARGMATWGEFFRLTAGAVARDGDVALVKIADGTLAMVESDCIDGPNRGNQYASTIGGITVDKSNGRPTQLWVAPRNSGGFADPMRAVPYAWDQIEFCANRTRSSQTRGMPPLVAGLDDFERGDSLLESTVVQAEQASNIYGVIKRIRQELSKGTGANALAPVTTDGNAAPLNAGASNTDQIPEYVAAARGALMMLYDDQEFSQVENENPNLNVPPFMTFLLRLHSLGLSYPYEIAFMDMGTASWSAHKTLITLAREGMNRWRGQVFEPSLHGITTWQLQRWIKEDGGNAPRDWDKFEWNWPQLPWPDPLKEEQTNALALRLRTTSLQRITRHWQEIQNERSQEERAQDALTIERIAAAQDLITAANQKNPDLKLHWSHIVAIAGADTAPGAFLQGANPQNGGGSDEQSNDGKDKGEDKP